MMTIREYKQAESLEEAWQLNQKKANRVLGDRKSTRLNSSHAT